jgi:pentatricopeptide repeat protein
MKARAATRHLEQLRAHLLRRGHTLPPAPHSDPDRAHLSVLHCAASPRLALDAYACLRAAGLPPPGRRALPGLLRAAARCCEGDAATLVGGTHGLAVRVGVQEDGFVGTALVGAYAARGSVVDARRVFDGMAVRDVVAWGVMLHR